MSRFLGKKIELHKHCGSLYTLRVNVVLVSKLQKQKMRSILLGE
jgi:hypothetical protein